MLCLSKQNGPTTKLSAPERRFQGSQGEPGRRGRTRVEACCHSPFLPLCAWSVLASSMGAHRAHSASTRRPVVRPSRRKTAGNCNLIGLSWAAKLGWCGPLPAGSHGTPKLPRDTRSSCSAWRLLQAAKKQRQEAGPNGLEVPRMARRLGPARAAPPPPPLPLPPTHKLRPCRPKTDSFGWFSELSANLVEFSRLEEIRAQIWRIWAQICSKSGGNSGQNLPNCGPSRTRATCSGGCTICSSQTERQSCLKVNPAASDCVRLLYYAAPVMQFAPLFC